MLYMREQPTVAMKCIIIYTGQRDTRGYLYDRSLSGIWMGRLIMIYIKIWYYYIIPFYVFEDF